MAVAKKSKFEAQLVRDNKTIRADRGKRIAESLADAQARLIMDIKGEKRKREDALAAMTDLTSDNQTTSMNVISPNFNADTFVREMNKLQVEIKKLDEQLSVAESTNKDWFLAE